MNTPDSMNTPRIKLPGSKSVAARALILDRVHALGLRFTNMPECDDTRELRQALGQLGVPGVNSYNLGSGGTSLRFFTALAASMPDFEGIVDCDEALRGRPLAPLVDALRRAGADIRYLAREARAPLYIKGRVLDGHGVRADSSISSQFASALTLVANLWKNPPADATAGVSAPYLEMTRRMCRAFKNIRPGEVYAIEPDWSAASYFYEYALLHPGKPIRLQGLIPAPDSLQGDATCAALFAELGVISRFDDGGVTVTGTPHRPAEWRKNLCDTPDLTPALVAAMCRAGIHFEISGIRHLRVKESDRIAAIAGEMKKMGYMLLTGDDSITYKGDRIAVKEDSFDAHGDHRMVMALAAAGVHPEKIHGKESVTKSFPNFFSRLSLLCPTAK